MRRGKRASRAVLTREKVLGERACSVDLKGGDRHSRLEIARGIRDPRAVATLAAMAYDHFVDTLAQFIELESKVQPAPRALLAPALKPAHRGA